MKELSAENMSLLPSYVPPLARLDFRRLDGAVIAMNRRVPCFIRISALGEEMLRLNDGKRTLKDIAGELTQKGLLNEETALGKVTEFYQGVLESGLLDEGKPWSLEHTSPGFYMEVTRKCNQHCAYCYADGGPDGGEGLETAELKGIISRMARTKAGFVIISGGEPLLRPDIFEILQHASDLLPVSLITNGTLIGRETAGRLASVEKLDIRLSLDGPGPSAHDPLRGAGSFAGACEGLKNLLDAGMADRISICAAISRINVDQAPSLARFALMHGVKSMVLSTLSYSGRGKGAEDLFGASAESLYRMYLKLLDVQDQYRGELEISGSLGGNLMKFASVHKPLVRCPVGRRMAVDYRGRIYPCSLMMDKPFILGNALEDDFNTIMSSALCRSFSAIALGRREQVKECAGCFWNGYCGAGCMARAYQQGDSLLTKDPDCQIIVQLLDRLALRIPTVSREVEKDES